MHVVVAGWLCGPHPSGANRRMLSILRAMEPLLDQGEQVTVLHRPGALPDDPPAAVRWQPIEIRDRPTLRRALDERRALNAALNAQAATLLEIGTLPVPGRIPCPVSLTVHDLRDLDGFRSRPAWLVRRVLRQSLRRVACVTVPSAFTAKRLRDAMGGMLPPTEIVPGGVSEMFLNTVPRLPEGRRFFLHVGHLEPRKNLMLLLSAYAAMLDEIEGDRDPTSLPALWLAGADGGERAALTERAAMLDLTGHVHFLGRVDEGQLHRLYANATAVLVPSLHEGFGLTALEGLAIGVPVLVSDRGALPEVVGTAGTILAAEDVRVWAEALLHVADAPRRPAEIEMRKRRARDFSWSVAAEQTLGLWRRFSAV